MNVRKAEDNSMNIISGEVLLSPRRRRTPDGGEMKVDMHAA